VGRKRNHRLPMAAFNLTLGILIFLCSWAMLILGIEPFPSWFYCFAWWSYILVIDSIVFKRTGSSLMLRRIGEFLFLLPLSVVIWLVFEAFNLLLKNWYYVNVIEITALRWAGYCISFATVLPGIFETTELIESTRWLKTWRVRPRSFSVAVLTGIMLTGAASLALCIIYPRTCFALVWCGFFLLLDPINYRCGAPSLLKGWEQGSLRKPMLLMTAGFICGILWEFWNYWAAVKWIYTVPFFDRFKIFEMTAPGFLGFIPFSLECYAMTGFFYLFRNKCGWERNPGVICRAGKTRLPAAISAVLAAGAWCFLIFTAIDKTTVDSYRPFIRDLPVISAAQKQRLEICGIIMVKDLLYLKSSVQQREKIMRCVPVSPEELSVWLKTADMVMLKGMGIQNYCALAAAGIADIRALAAQEPRALHRALEKAAGKSPVPIRVPVETRMRIWIAAARDSIIT
jgi:hypothetical protein